MDTQVINTSSKNESAKETLKKGAALTGAAGLGAGAVVSADVVRGDEELDIVEPISPLEVVDTATGEAHYAGTYAGSNISNLTALNEALKNAKFAPSDAGKTVSVEITKDDFKMTIPGIKIETVNIEDVAKLDITSANKPVYTGKQTAFADAEITNNFKIKEKNGTNTYSGLDSSNFTYTL